MVFDTSKLNHSHSLVSQSRTGTSTLAFAYALVGTIEDTLLIPYSTWDYQAIDFYPLENTRNIKGFEYGDQLPKLHTGVRFSSPAPSYPLHSVGYKLRSHAWIED